MTQEDKQLLLKDLLPRQLYDVKTHYQYYDFVGSSERLIQEGDGTIKSIDISLGNPIYIDGYHVEMENIKPYLRPMSSMTEEEREEYRHSRINDKGEWTMHGLDDYCYEHHLDFRGLIEKGLALEAPEGMYK